VSPIALYARSDLACIAIPVETGGCGTSHSRPVFKGAPAKTWKLDCPPCEAVLKGSHKQQKLIYETDRKTGAVLRQVRVPDSDPMWSSTPETVPQTPDEERTHELRIERGEQQLRALESIATLAKAGINFRDREDVLFFLREHQLPEDVIQGAVVCANGHDNPSGAKFCGECGVSMAARGTLPPADAGAPVDLGRLHVQSLRKMCRDAGLPDKGSKDALIGRLQAA
jgi:hypothetical protein